MAEDRPPVADSSQASEPAAVNNAAPVEAAGAQVFDAVPPMPDLGAAAADAEASGVDQATIDALLKQASVEDPAQAMAQAPSVATEQLELPRFQQAMQDAQVNSVDLLRDVDLNVKIELGRSRMLVEDVLKLGEGSVVELDKLAGDPVDVFINERLIARGEVLVLNDNFCVRINEIVAGVKEEGL